MDEKNLISNVQYYKIKLDILIFFCLGFLLIFVQPLNDGYFKNWLFNLYGSYSISLYELFLIPLTYFGLIYLILSNFSIKKYEYLLYFSILLVIISRILSLLFAKQIMSEQCLGPLRYIWGLLLIPIFSIIFSKYKNRYFFIIGFIVGVIVESIGGILKYLLSNGQLRGIFISGSSYVLQIYLLFICIYAIEKSKKYKISLYTLIFFLFLSIIFTGSRSAWILVLTMLIIMLLKKRKSLLKPLNIVKIVLFIILISVIILTFIPKFSFIVNSVTMERFRSAVKLTGTINYRFFLWEKAIRIFLEHPITGIGTGGFVRNMYILPQTFYFKVSEYLEDVTHSAHHAIFAILVETGIVGLISYFLWIISILNICRKCLNLTDLQLKGDVNVMVLSLFIISLIIAEFWGGPGMFFGPFSFIFLGFLLGYLREKTKEGF